MIRASLIAALLARDSRARWRRRPSPSSTARSRSATARSRSRTARSSSATAGSSRPGHAMQAARRRAGHRRDAANGSRRESSPASRGSAWPRSICRAETASRRHRAPTNEPVQRRDRRRARDQPAGLDHRGQPRRRRHPRARRAERRQEHLRRAGRGDRHRRRHGPDHRGAAVPVRRAWRDRRGQGRRLARRRRTSCSATRCARPPSFAAMRRRSSRRGAAPDERDRPVVRDPNESRLYGPTRGAARTCC